MPTTFANSINNNLIYADRAEHDAAGNDLQTTYATKSEVTTGLALKEDSSNKSQTLDPSSSTEFPSSSATANYVNSSVATATANFLGNFTLTELGLTYPATDAQIGAALDAHTWPAGVTPTNNDYTYIEIENPQTTGIDDSVERFKFNGTNWVYEYTLNNSSFTAAEKAAIDSGIDSAKVAIYDAHVADTTIHVTSTDKSTWNAKQDAISDLATIRSGASAGATAVQPGDLATVATTGDYSDLLNKPDLSVYAESADLATVATTGAYSDLSGTPTIPTATSDLTNDSGFITLSDVPAQVNADWNSSSGASEILNKPTLATVATSGDYDDLTNKPTIPAALSAGNGIDITSNTVSVDLDGSTLTNGANGLSVTLPVPAVTSSDDGKVLTADYTGGVASYSWETPSAGSRIVELTIDTSTWADFTTAYTQLTAGTIDGIRAKYVWAGGDYYADLVYVKTVFGAPNSATFSAPAYSSVDNSTGRWVSSALFVLDSMGHWTETYPDALASDIVAGTGISVSHDAPYNNIVVAVSDPLPAHTSTESGKVLTVNSSGNPVWETPSAGGSRIVELTYGTSTWSDFTTAYDQLTAGTIDGIRAKKGNYYADLVYVHPDIFSTTPIGATFSAPAYNIYGSSSNGKRLYSLLFVLGSNGVWTTTDANTLASNIMAGTGISVSTDASYNIVVAASDPLPAHTSTESGKVLTVNSSGNTVWETPASAPVTDVEVDGVSVVSSGVASITMPTFTQAQANWNESDTSAASYIQNKPSIPSATSDLTNDSGFITLSDVPAQVNADWNSSSGASEILNKPTIPTVPSAGNMLSVTNNTLDVTTTAGITDIQQVNALPANPVSTVLYLIPET